jgi:hypothetical protein
MPDVRIAERLHGIASGVRKMLGVASTAGEKTESRKAPAAVPEAEAPSTARAPPVREPFAERVIINHGRERRLELTLVQGDITRIDASCYAVGLFKAVAPAGAALALDRAMDGRISELVARRMFGADVGEVSVLPNGRRAMRAPNVAFVGLGAFDSFTPDTLKLACDNLVRTFVAAGLDDFAMVPFGWSWADDGDPSGEKARALVDAMLSGFLRAIEDSDRDYRFRGLTICERDPKRFDLINDEIHDLGQRESFNDFELTIRVIRLPEPPVERAAAAAGPAPTARIYLMAREVPQQGRAARAPLMMSVLTTGAKAAILMGQQPGSADDLEQALDKLDAYGEFTDNQANGFGDDLAGLLLDKGVGTALKKYAGCHLVVVHDAAASRIPWETLRIDGKFPALEGGLSHRYEASDLSVAKWLQSRQQSEVLSVLLVANPTKDLEGAKLEGERVSNLLKHFHRYVQLDELWGDDASKDALHERFASGKYDVVHFAGHAFFDPQQRGRSGVYCAGGEVLSGIDLATIDNLPTLMFFNACEAARVRGPGEAAEKAKNAPQMVQGGIGFAEALLRGGIANFIGTYWPVGDQSALAFATNFYPALLRGATLNEALLSSRLEVRKVSEDWADYVFYGEPDFRLKAIQGTGLPTGEANGQ